ncbi:MAG: putative glycoside hydrolase [Fusobacteriaceae bacterium]
MKKFLIAISLMAFFISCGKTETVEMVKGSYTFQGEELKKDESSESTAKEAEVSEVKKESKPSEEPKIEEIQTKVEEPLKEETVKEVVPEETTFTEHFYTNIANLQVFNAATGGQRIDYLRKGTRVTILEEITSGNQKPETYVKVSYLKDRKTKEGWITKKVLVPSINDLLPQQWGKLNFDPFLKKEYPNNPKVKVKGIYVSTSTVSTPKALDRLIELAKTTEINAFVIDVKNDDGHLLWSMPEVVSKYGLDSDKRRPIKNIEALMAKLKENNIYTIARVVSFKDPTYAKAKPERTILDKRTGKPFSNADGLIWVSAHDRELWQYNIDVSKEAARVGFNEIQFDYVRFPASNGGKLDPHLNYRNPKNESKPAAIQRFLTEAYKQLSPLEVYTAADVYGQVGSSPDDMALGQHWEAVSNVVDYICPMVYPSHYGNGVYGAAVPDAEPYKTVYGSSRDSMNRSFNIDTPATIRTWIQDFSAPWVKGHIKYGKKEVKEQIRALNALGLEEYILWNAANRYSFEKKSTL